MSAAGENGARKAERRAHLKGVEGERLAHDIFQLAESVIVGLRTLKKLRNRPPALSAELEVM